MKDETRAAGAGLDTCLYIYRGTWVVTISIPQRNHIKYDSFVK
nr:MAG TPA: hypothetical protein [Caudoviricetes sp.]